MSVLSCYCEEVEQGGMEYHCYAVNPPAGRSSLSFRAVPGPAFGVHDSQKVGKGLTAAVCSVGSTLDRVNMMFMRVGSSSFYCLTLPHGLLPSGFYNKAQDCNGQALSRWYKW